MGTVSGHQLSTFSSPVNGTTPIDANTVRGNDNTIKSSYNAHDADPTIHLQNGVVSARPAASTAGQTWLASDTGAVYLWLDTGSAWVEANYLRNTGGTVNGQVTVVSTTAPQFTAEYDSTHKYTVSVDSSGNATLNATGTITVTPSVTLSGALSAQAVTATGVTVRNPGANSIVTLDGAPTANQSGFIWLATSTTQKSFLVGYNITQLGALEFGRATTNGGTTYAGPDAYFNNTGALVLNAGLTVSAGGITVSAGTVTTAASATGGAGFNLSHGTAPTSPVNGDMWSTTAGLFIRINGTTKTVTLT